MPVNLSIKNAPDEIVQRLRGRAKRHHRSLQGKLMAILEAAARHEDRLSTNDLLAEIRRLGLRTPSESAAMIRAGRDAFGPALLPAAPLFVCRTYEPW